MYLAVGALLFCIGVYAVLARRNAVAILMGIELMLNAVNINLIAFSNQLQNTIGQVFAVFVIAVAAAEAAVGLGIILAFYRNKETVNIDEMNLMKW
jgi:NADH:ubiquinone oxidoreductase subunit K